MSATSGSLGIVVYAPALRVDDPRPLAVVRGLEKALPGLRLEWRVSEEGRPVPLPQRDAWLAEAVARGEGPLICNGDESHPVALYGLELMAGFAPGGNPLLDLHVDLPLDEAVISVAVKLLDGVGDGASALWGHATPDLAAVEIAQQTRHPFLEAHTPPRGLPLLKHPSELRAPEIPQRLGWLNYWSAAAAKAIGFPEAARGGELLARAKRTAAGGWILRLTDAPLELDDPTHIEALLRMYEWFPGIGGRAIL